MDVMDGRDWTGLKGKKVYLETKSGRNYSGIIKDIVTFQFHYEIYLIDKFGKAVIVRNDQIVVLNEERE